MAYTIITAGDLKAIGRKAPVFTSWYDRSQRPTRSGEYQMRLVDGSTFRARYDVETRRWTHRKTVVQRSLIHSWRGLTRQAYLGMKDVDAFLQDEVTLSAFPKVPASAIFAKMASTLGNAPF